VRLAISHYKGFYETYRSILALLLYLGFAFFMDYLLDFVLSGKVVILSSHGFTTGFSFLCQVIFGAFILLLIYYAVRKEWLTRKTAIAFIVVGGIILLYTPLWISFTEVFPNTMDSIYLKNPGFKMPAFWARSFFTLAGL